MIEEVGASARTLLARFTSGIKAGQRVVGAPWPSAKGEGVALLALQVLTEPIYVIQDTPTLPAPHAPQNPEKATISAFLASLAEAF